MCMLSEQIELLRNKLDALIKEHASYEEIYQTSQELDKYITEYYKMTM